jgi:hypothetical protein
MHRLTMAGLVAGLLLTAAPRVARADLWINFYGLEIYHLPDVLRQGCRVQSKDPAKRLTVVSCKNNTSAMTLFVVKPGTDRGGSKQPDGCSVKVRWLGLIPNRWDAQSTSTTGSGCTYYWQNVNTVDIRSN